MAMTMRLAPFFPARVLPGDAIAIIRAGGSITIKMDWSQIQQSSLPIDPENYEFTLRNADGSFIRVPVSDIILPVVTWDTLSGKPSTFPPSAHTHDIDQVNGLQLVLDAKVNTTDTIPADHGGTGQTGYTIGDLLYASSTTALSKLAAGTSTYVLTSNGAGTAPSWQAPAVAPAGSVISSAYAEYTANVDLTATIPADDTQPQNTEGTQVLSVTVTPSSTSDKVRLRFTSWGYVGSAQYVAAIFRSGAANALQAKVAGGDAAWMALDFEVEDSPATTSAVTYTIRVGPSTSGTLRLNGSASARSFGGSSRATLVAEVIKG
ncbi:hypothetical protein [Bosea sp. (in: a-proteobacteria)]|uniref:hypothetical protein n=1 Tax=Bosea sp. (in: a-proteobacteria) TaxID=1871050 RepID=UPI00262E7CD2|nr:hypothetical protein [Bosea sp. (in: a-proteobacteria)]MCO5092678.1 hypothetical protein [Bosea sp. (in: a-proteobacteria)]